MNIQRTLKISTKCWADRERLIPIGGNPVDLLNMPDGCPCTRCNMAMKVLFQTNLWK